MDFYATWCGPCKVIAPKVVEFSKEYPEVDFIKVDVDDLSDVAAEYNIRAMPTFLLFKDGKQVDNVVGANASKRKSQQQDKSNEQSRRRLDNTRRQR